MLTEQGRERSAAVGKETEIVVPIGVGSLRGRTTCSIEEASKILQIGRSTAYAAARDGSLPVLRISHRLLVSVPRLLALIGIEDERCE